MARTNHRVSYVLLLTLSTVLTVRNNKAEHHSEAHCTSRGQYAPLDAPSKDNYLPSHSELFRGVYSFSVGSIPISKCSSDKGFQYIRESKPVVLQGCTFANSALKWDVDYLSRNVKDDTHPIYVSQTRNFYYYDLSKVTGVFRNWTAPHEARYDGFKEFQRIVSEFEQANNESRAYFQSLLFPSDMSDEMTEDYKSLNHTWLLELVSDAGWPFELINVLFVGMKDVVTPAHYDTFENLYLQISGKKRCILFSPENFTGLYPYPLGHPHDRQTQVNFDSPDLSRFPRFADVTGIEYALEPGDVLYIPKYWWHYFESERNNMTVSINFWFTPKGSVPSTDDEESAEEELESDVGPAKYLELRRFIEETVYNNTGKNPQQVKLFFEELLNGRFDYT